VICADEQTLAAIRRRADQLADEAPPLSTNQALLLVSLCGRHSRADQLVRLIEDSLAFTNASLDRGLLRGCVTLLNRCAAPVPLHGSCDVRPSLALSGYPDRNANRLLVANWLVGFCKSPEW
jgi:hypothetical protein